ncbi:MAG: hypothetical protein AB8G18_02655 [Gammaproteobacteria bacterium]
MKALFTGLIASALVGMGLLWGEASQKAVPEAEFRSSIQKEKSNEPGDSASVTPAAIEQFSASSNQATETFARKSASADSNQMGVGSDVPAARNPGDALGANSRTVDSSLVRKIPISEEAQKTLGKGEPAELHRQLEESGRDDSWSPYMEAQLRDYLGHKANLSVFTFPIIECRNIGCEIQGIGYSENANQIWVNETADIYNQT